MNKFYACGHDIHIAMMLVAGALLKGKEEELEKTVKLCSSLSTANTILKKKLSRINRTKQVTS